MSPAYNSSPFSGNCSPDSASLEPPQSNTFVAVIYCIISGVGIVGNSCLIYIILSDRKMRSTGTNLFILNMAIADLIVMLIGVEELTAYIIDRGWLLGPIACKILRFSMTACLYASVLTLTAVCIERYIAIVHAMRAHIWCRRTRSVAVIVGIWFSAIVLGAPELIFLGTFCIRGRNVCVKIFAVTSFQDHMRGWLLFHYFQFTICYLAPMTLQIVLYVQIARTLFFSRRQLRNSSGSRRPNRPNLESHNMRPLSTRSDQKESENCGTKSENSSEKRKPNAVFSKSAQDRAIEARKQVVKMLIACLLVYFICNSPMAVPLLYNTVNSKPFVQSAVFRVAAIMMAYANSAANPILYSLFSNRFRSKFMEALLCCCRKTVGRDQFMDTQTVALPSASSRRSVMSRKNELSYSAVGKKN